MANGGILNDQHLQQINLGIQKAQDALKEVELAKRAGIPNIDQYETQLKDGLTKLQQIKSVYFPNG